MVLHLPTLLLFAFISTASVIIRVKYEVSFSQSPLHSHLFLADAHLMEFDHSVFGSHWWWQCWWVWQIKSDQLTLGHTIIYLLILVYTMIAVSHSAFAVLHLTEHCSFSYKFLVVMSFGIPPTLMMVNAHNQRLCWSLWYIQLNVGVVLECSAAEFLHVDCRSIAFTCRHWQHQITQRYVCTYSNYSQIL